MTSHHLNSAYDVEVADVGEHGVGVDLAHVVTLVLLLHVAHRQFPGVVLVVRHLNARVPRDHVVVGRQDHLMVDERHLQAEK